MNRSQAIEQMRQVLRRRHQALSSEDTYQFLASPAPGPRERGQTLNRARRPAILRACRFTNFIAGNARKTARSWCARTGGKGPSAPIAGRPSFRRSCRFLLPPAEGRAPKRRPAGTRAEEDAVATVPAGSTGIDFGSAANPIAPRRRQPRAECAAGPLRSPRVRIDRRRPARQAALGGSPWTNRRIRTMASLMFSKRVAYAHRTNPSPQLPKAVPGTTATFSSRSRLRAKSREDRPNLAILGKA